MLHLSEWIEENNENPPSGRLVEQDTIWTAPPDGRPEEQLGSSEWREKMIKMLSVEESKEADTHLFTETVFPIVFERLF
jgi:hypothetical protein